jgi:hypothetical protein
LDWNNVLENEIELEPELVRQEHHVHGLTTVSGDFRETDKDYLDGDVFHRIEDERSGRYEKTKLEQVVKTAAYVLSHSTKSIEAEVLDEHIKINRTFGVVYDFEPEDAVNDPSVDFTQEELNHLETRVSRLAEEVVDEYLEGGEETGGKEYSCSVCDAEGSFRRLFEFKSQYYNDELQDNYEYGWDLWCVFAMNDEYTSFNPPPDIRRDWESLWHDIGIEIALRKNEEPEEELLVERLVLYMSVQPDLFALVMSLLSLRLEVEPDVERIGVGSSSQDHHCEVCEREMDLEKEAVEKVSENGRDVWLCESCLREGGWIN